MRQGSFLELEYDHKHKRTRRDWCLAEIESYYSRGEGQGRPPIGCERILRMGLARQSFGLSDGASASPRFPAGATSTARRCVTTRRSTATPRGGPAGRPRWCRVRPQGDGGHPCRSLPEAVPIDTGNDEIHYRILRQLERYPRMSQRELADSLEISVGKNNHLSLRRIVAKALINRRLLDIKKKANEALREEIERLQREVGTETFKRRRDTKEQNRQDFRKCSSYSTTIPRRHEPTHHQP